MASDPLLSKAALDNMKEIMRIGEAVLGHAIPHANPEETLARISKIRGKSSFLVDYERGIPMEVGRFRMGG